MFKVLSKDGVLSTESFQSKEAAESYILSLDNRSKTEFEILEFKPLGDGKKRTKKSKNIQKNKSRTIKRKVDWQNGPDKLCRLNGRWYDGNVRYKPSRMAANHRSIYSGSTKMRRKWADEDNRLKTLANMR